MRKTCELLGVALLIGFGVVLVFEGLNGNTNTVLVFIDILCLIIFCVGAKIRRLNVIQGLLLFIMSLIQILLYPTSFFGYIVLLFAEYLLFFDGFFEKEGKILFTANIGIIVIVEVIGFFLNKNHPSEVVLTMLSADCLFLFMIKIFLKSISKREMNGKPKISLKERGLTDCEIAYTCLVLSGQSSKEIAHALHVQDGTVRTVLSRCYKKLGVRDRYDLHQLAFKNEIEESPCKC